MKLATLANVGFRSFFLEASWNEQGQQNLGLAAAVDPALKAIYREGENLSQARGRALDFFNTNPVASGVAIGVVIKLEEDVASGRIGPDERMRIASSLSRTLAAMGDSLIWQAWLPLCSLVAAWVLLSLEFWWAPLILPVLFCSLVIPLRFVGLYLGYRRVENIIDLLCRLKIQRQAQSLRRLVALVVGASMVIVLATKTALADHSNLVRLWLTIAAVLVSVICLRFVSQRVGRLNYWYPPILVGLAFLFLFVFKQG